MPVVIALSARIEVPITGRSPAVHLRLLESRDALRNVSMPICGQIYLPGKLTH